MSESIEIRSDEVTREKITKKKGKGATDPQKQVFEEIMRRTLHEMILDLGKISPSSATKMSLLTETYTGQDILRELRKEDSELCTVIPQACHDIGTVGEKYLSVFTMIQPALSKSMNTDVASSASSTKPLNNMNNNNMNNNVNNKVNNKKRKKQKKVTVPTTTLATTTPNPSETIERLLSGTEDKDLLLSLADSIFKDLDLGDQPNEQMSMPDMFSLMTKACGVVQEKVSAGDIDMDKLQGQAMSFCQQIQHNPDLQNIIASNPVLAGLQLDVQSAQAGSSSPAAADSAGGLGNLLMGMMGSYQTG